MSNSPGTVTLTNSIIALNTGSPNADLHGPLDAGSGFNLIGADPLFVRNPSPGDPGDLRLLPGSPAINMGSNALAVDAQGNPLVRDLDGRPRMIYDSVDIGAYEFGLVGDANADYVVDDTDASILGAHWRQQAGATWADGDFNSDGKVDDRDAAILAAHWGQEIEMAAPAEGAGAGTVGTEGTGPSRGFIGPRAVAVSPDARRVIEPRPAEAALRDKPAVARAAGGEGRGDGRRTRRRRTARLSPGVVTPERPGAARGRGPCGNRRAAGSRVFRTRRIARA